MHDYEAKNCIGCGNCALACKKNAITMIENTLYKPPHGDYIRLILRMLPPVLLMGTKIKLMRYFARS
jgi:ferredoxin